jgi:hypothetical protein
VQYLQIGYAPGMILAFAAFVLSLWLLNTAQPQPAAQPTPQPAAQPTSQPAADKKEG